MSIRIGSGCALSPPMGIGAVVETRSFIGSTSRCWEVVDKAIANRQYLIFNICINRNDKSGHNPSDDEWKLIVDNTCKELRSRGCNRLNSYITIINEPMKYISISRYAKLVNYAFPIVHNHGFLMGAGNEQYTMAMSKGNMYSYILQNCKFDILDIHLQGDCENDDDCRNIADVFKRWATNYNKQIDCTECFYSDIATSKGWNILKFQIEHAERIGCKNVCNVFNNLDRSQFPWDTKGWDKLCFNINGHNRSGYYGQYLDLVKSKAPVPNIKEIFEMYGIEINYVKFGSHNEETRAVQKIMLDEGYDLSPYGADSWYGSVTENAIKKWQGDNDLKVDGIVGKDTWQWIFENLDTGLLRFMQMIARTGRYK